MRVSRKLLSLFLIAFFAFVIVSCGGTSTDITTQSQTTGLTTSEITGTVVDTTSEVTTENPGEDGVPYFTGLFTRQSYYRGSQPLDLLAGAKAIDPEDGELEIQLVGGYTATRVGTYSVYAVAQDSNDNIISEEIVLTVKDLKGYTIPDTLTSDPITIELWHSNGSSVETALNDYADDFMALYPNITVNIVKSGANYDELRENVINAIKGGQLPNIVQNYPDHVMEYIDNAAVIPLTPYIYNSTWGYNPDVESESFLDILLSYRRENSQYTMDGEYYSVPFNKSTEVMIYNKTMFDMLIADGVIDEVPTTWQGLFAIADDLMAIKDDAIDAITDKMNSSTAPDALNKSPEEIQAIKDNFVPIAYDSPANAFITLTRQWGGEYTGINAQREGLILFDNDEVRDMLSYFFDNRTTAFTVPGLWGSEYASDAFVTGQCAVTFGSTGGARYNTPDMIDNPDTVDVDPEFTFEFGVAPMPYNADMPEERTAIQQGTNMSITTAGTDQQKLASWLFLRYLTSKEVQLNFALETGYSPVRSTCYDDPIFGLFRQGKDAAGNDLTGENLMKSLAANAAAEQSDYLFFDQAYVGSSDARAAVEVAFERVILGSLEGTTKDEIINNAIAAAKDAAEKTLG
ncbi:MAG TPA: extracellular solute-binding protein [Lachnospiraceae bacterium]|nr:extracellular solute-binding protein [Lachnospiraceae bacterium]